MCGIMLPCRDRQYICGDLWRGVLNEEHVHVVGLTRILQISSVVRRRMRGCASRSAGREAHITISEEKGTCYVNVCH